MAFLRKAAHAGPADSRRLARRMLAILLVLVMGVCCYSVTVMAWFENQAVNAGNTIRTGEFAARIVLEDAAGSVLWSSDTESPDGIQQYGGDIVLAGGAPARLRIYSHIRSSLAFQYQIRLTAADGTVWNMTADPEGNALILEPAGDEEYPLNFREGTSSLRLDFRTAFQKSSIEPLPPLTTTATTAAPTTPAARPAPTAPAAAAGESTMTTAGTVTATATTTVSETEPSSTAAPETTTTTDAAQATEATEASTVTSQTVSASEPTTTTSDATAASPSDETTSASASTASIDDSADSTAVSTDDTAASSDAEGA